MIWAELPVNQLISLTFVPVADLAYDLAPEARLRFADYHSVVYVPQIRAQLTTFYLVLDWSIGSSALFCNGSKPYGSGPRQHTRFRPKIHYSAPQPGRTVALGGSAENTQGFF